MWKRRPSVLRRRRKPAHFTPGRVGVSLAVMLSSSLWERYSAWWQEAFTEGADPEYEEQVLPLVENSLRGARRVLDVGCGEGQVARRLARLGADVIGLTPVCRRFVWPTSGTVRRALPGRGRNSSHVLAQALMP